MTFQNLLEEKLKLTKDRDMFAASEIRDWLLDLWNAIEKEGTNVVKSDT